MRYPRGARLERFYNELGVSNSRKLSEEARYFTAKEAKKRDKIVADYFGPAGINRIVDTITSFLLDGSRLPSKAKILDLGCGTGFFTVKVAENIRSRLPTCAFYGMDLTPAMLTELERKSMNITPFLGIAENINGSARKAGRFGVPSKFDAVFSTLMLHHSLEPKKVFESLKAALERNGKAIIIDLCEHRFEEFKTEMGDVHLGFKPESIDYMMRLYFSEARVEKMPGISCECSGRAAEVFVASMQNG